MSNATFPSWESAGGQGSPNIAGGTDLDEEMRETTNKIVMLLKGDGIPVKRRLVEEMTRERIKLDRQFHQGIDKSER